MDGQFVEAHSYAEYRDTQRAFLAFLGHRSSDAFLHVYVDVDPDLPSRLVDFTSFVNAVYEPDVLARLHQIGLLTEQVRLQAVERMRDLAVSSPDDGWITGRAWKILLTADDRARLFKWVRTDLVPRLETGEGWLGDERDPDDDPVESALRDYSMAFEHVGDFEASHAFDEAVDWHSQLPAREREDDPESWATSPLTGSRLAPPPSTGRSMFDDIDAE